ncbi:MAG TPA: hypothetical protein VJ997_11840, partial [Longimicrobiales bacterium]|nr:hypothetical protein [Longimicrobiales bacterium]
QVGDDSSAAACVQGYSTVPGLLDFIAFTGLVTDDAGDGVRAAACELTLEALVGMKRISRSSSGGYARARHEPPEGKGYKGFDPLGGMNV